MQDSVPGPVYANERLHMTPLVVWVLAALATATAGCGEMRQNMRGEYVSYRGAWFCAKAGCDEGQMQRATRGHREGDVTVNHGKMAAGAALVFKAGKPTETMRASVRDCAGTTADVPADKLRAPGKHGVVGQSDAWAVLVVPADYPTLKLGGSCKKWTVTTHATWDKGTSWEQRAGLQNE